MDVVAQGSVAASCLLWQRGPSWVLTVVCKATFDLAPGDARLRSTPEPANEHDVPWEGSYARSLRAATDLIPIKPNVDIVLTGHAYAPAGRPVRSLIAGLTVGAFEKNIEVFADRYFDAGGTLREGPPFKHMPLVYERAAGGPGTWNPAGIRVGQRDAHGNIPLPNLLAPGTPVLSPERLFIAPAGFGPLPADWPSRVEKLGRRSPRDLPVDWRGQSVPDDIGRDYFNVAPVDQQIETLHEDEMITLENLHASQPSLTCRLPGLRPTATLEVRGAPAAISVRLDTLHIDTDRGTCTLVWRGHMPLRDPREAGRLVVVLDGPVQAMRRPTFTGNERAPDPTTTVESSFEGTMQLGANVVAATLPFAPAPPRPASGREALGQSSSSWGSTPARDPLAQSASSWNTVSPPRPSAQSSPSWSAVTAPPAIDPLAQSASSWGAAAPALETAQSPSLPAQGALPPPAPPPRRPMGSSSWEVAPPAPVSAPALVASAAVSGSPWAAGSAGQPRETIGMAAAAGALALADPKYEPLPAERAAVDPGSRAVQLLWFNPDSVARIRRVPRWKQLLEDLVREPLDRDLDEGGGSGEPWEIEDRREVFEVLARGAQSDARGVEEALDTARGAGGKLVPPLVLVEGELEVQLDELEALKAAATTAAPLVTPMDEGLRAAVEAADKFLARPGISSMPAVCEGLHTRIREAFAREKKGLPGDYLDKQVERALLSGRHYQKREVLGGTFLRGMIWIPGEREGVLGYVPEELGKKLPMYRRVGVRMIGEVVPRQEQFEAQAIALKVVGVGRAD